MFGKAYADGLTCRCSLFPLPPPRVGVPNAVGEQAIQIGEIWVTALVEAQAFAIFFAGHLPVHTCRRGSSGWKYAQPSADQPQCGQRSTSQPSRWRSPTGAPQSGQGPSVLLMNTCQCILWPTLFSPEFLKPHRRAGLAVSCPRLASHPFTDHAGRPALELIEFRRNTNQPTYAQ
jgi:hypothetical protein